jgi:CHAT domain-containing protein
LRSRYGGELLLDEDFEQRRFEERLAADQPGVVHIASHAVFGGDPSQSFVVSHDGRITLDEMAAALQRTQYREQPVELLVLSACETAAGNDRAALGLAGVAIRSGVRSALGSLWSINDETTSTLMLDFYAALQEPNVSKAEALRRAQLALLSREAYRHPFYWSPFVLLSNWM